MLVEQLTGMIAGAPLRTLDDVSRDIWRALSNGLLTDEEAQHLAEAIHSRRTSIRQEPQRGGATRSWSYFPPKRPQRSPDRQRSIQRRRRLAASGPLPPTLAAHFTTGELAALRIVADEVQQKRVCGLTLAEIAARAGVCDRTARNAIRHAERLGLLTIEERRRHCAPNLPNLVRVISREWLIWLERRGGGKKIQPTTKDSFQERGSTPGMPPTGSRKLIQSFSLNPRILHPKSQNRRLWPS